MANGTASLRLVITDAAGNQRQSAVVPVSVDSTGPSVTLNDPGALLSGPVRSHDHGRRRDARRLRDQSRRRGSWTQLAEDTTAPFGATLDTKALADGLYDLRAIGYDSFGNPSTASLRSGIRFDNTAPRLVSSTPQDGSVSTAANRSS